MSAIKFYTRAIAWLRNERSLDTEVRVAAQLEEQPSGGARVRGRFTSPSSAGSWAFAGLCTMAIGSVLTLFNPPGVSPAAQVAIERAGLVAQVAGVTCLATAELKRRRSRVPAIVELRPRATAPATPKSIAALREASRGAAAWLVVERSPSRELLAAAAEHGVRCFVLRGGRFHEDGKQPSPMPAHERGDA